MQSDEDNESGTLCFIKIIMILIISIYLSIDEQKQTSRRREHKF